jgi:hypothetical protein
MKDSVPFILPHCFVSRTPSLTVGLPLYSSGAVRG